MARQFTDDEIAQALAVLAGNGGNAKKTAQALGIPRTTLRQWAGRTNPQVGKKVSPALVIDAGGKLADNWERIALEAQGNVSEKLSAANAYQSALIAGIATDKRQLLRGLATSRSETTQIVYVQPNALSELSMRILDGDYTEKPKALAAEAQEAQESEPQTD